MWYRVNRLNVALVSLVWGIIFIWTHNIHLYTKMIAAVTTSVWLVHPISNPHISGVHVTGRGQEHSNPHHVLIPGNFSWILFVLIVSTFASLLLGSHGVVCSNIDDPWNTTTIFAILATSMCMYFIYGYLFILNIKYDVNSVSTTPINNPTHNDSFMVTKGGTILKYTYPIVDKGGDETVVETTNNRIPDDEISIPATKRKKSRKCGD
jgi:hypothetical protein